MNATIFRSLMATFFAPTKLQWFQTYVLPQNKTTPSVQSSSEKTVQLSALNNSGESGTATLKEVNGQVVVTLTLTGVPAQGAQPAHIHTVSCPNPGAVKYSLTSPINGKSVTTIPVTLNALAKEVPLAINVHKSAQDVATYVSCGNVVLK